MEDEEFQDLVDESEDDYDSTHDITDEQLAQYEGTVPYAKEKSDIYTWFWRVVRLAKPYRLVKVGNLDKVEIGEHGVTVRDALNLAYLGKLFHHKKFGEYWETRAKITSASSMAKKGWFMDLSISQKKVRERARSPAEQQKWRLFQKKKGIQYAE